MVTESSIKLNKVYLILAFSLRNLFSMNLLFNQLYIVVYWVFWGSVIHKLKIPMINVERLIPVKLVVN